MEVLKALLLVSVRLQLRDGRTDERKTNGQTPGIEFGANLDITSGEISSTFKFLQVYNPPIYRVAQKLAQFFVLFNFIKYLPIFKLISLLESKENL